MDRRRFLAAVGTTALVGHAVTRPDATELSSFREGPTIGLEPVVEGLREPLAFRTARNDRLKYVADKHGHVFVHDSDGLREEPFLDVSDQLVAFSSWEQGLLGFELHPDFENNGKCYVRYSAPPDDELPDEYNHWFVLSEFQADRGRRRVNPDSERVLLEIPEPGENHNSGAIVFGPDGYLYVGVGDGRSGSGDRGTGHAKDWYWLNEGGNGQNVTANLHGSILRIDVDDQTGEKEYAIPDDNPLVGKQGLDEQYAWGFRNPYRMSFSAGDLYVGDVGEGHVEEVDRVVKGGNYGWNVKEGHRCYNNRLWMAALAKTPWFEKTYPVCPDETSDGEPLRDPVVAYPHYREGRRVGSAVIGGYLFENETVPALQNQYVFGDLSGRGSGLFVATPTEDGLWPMASVDVTTGPTMENRFVLSLGRDGAGELYVLSTQFTEGSGEVHRITPSN